MRHKSRITGLIFFTLACLHPFAAMAQEATFSPRQIEFFENRIRPLLVEHCLECHGADKTKIRGGLYLTSRSAMLKGGDSGPALIPGDPEESLLIRCVRYEDYEMPPESPLSDQQIQYLTEWIKMGAPDPRTTDSENSAAKTMDLEAGRKFWAFQPRVKAAASGTLSDPRWVSREIDRFIEQGRTDASISAVSEASRPVLLRRVYLALVGLPPTPEQYAQFVADPSETNAALSKVVDELLESEHFGQRWGRHWLDVARFAESSGGGRSLMFPDAWRFRDYVIDAYNKDKPFDQFVREQIAGDLLPWDDHAQKIEQLVATGFLALGPTNYEQQDKELLRMEVIDEQVDTIGRAFMGLTLGCARCHDHKFDPIPMTDYYALAGIFKSTDSLVDSNVSKYVEQPLATADEMRTRTAYLKQVNALTQQRKEVAEALKALGGGPNKSTNNKRVAVEDLTGIVLDNTQADRVGRWKSSNFSPLFVGEAYLHDEDANKGKKQITFTPRLERGGRYEVRLSYSPGGNRASNVPVTIEHQDGRDTVVVNQSQKPDLDGLFVSLGTFRFEANNRSSVTISNKGTDGHVIVDALQMIFQSEPNLSSPQPSVKQTKNSALAATEDEVEDARIESAELRQVRERLDRLDADLVALKKTAPQALPVAMSVKDSDSPGDGNLHIRGAVRRLGQSVPRGFVSVCCQDSSPPAIGEDESGRLQLANWLADPQHPLTARVYVNRVWRHLFGQGIVATPDNFGEMGQRPTHPALLDLLADAFIQGGWSTKQLIRSIMDTEVYRLANLDHPISSSHDPENRWLWRANRRRVDVEVLRDSILSISGELDLTSGGRTIRKLSQYDLGYEFDTVRRSVYVPAFRNSMLDAFEVFDFTNPNVVTGNRITSTLPTQALFMMNSPMVIEQSRKAALRLGDRAFATQEGRVNWVYQQVLGRKPSPQEMTETRQHLLSFEDKETGWASVYHALFASLEFRYVQ